VSPEIGMQTTIEEIKAAISKLSLAERAELAKWLHGWTDDEWDRQIANDRRSGRLDDVLKEVDDEIDSDQLRDLP
jgi:hypothetical protein